MFSLLLIVIYLSYFGCGMPYSLPGVAWPSMYEGMAVPDSWLGIVSMILMCCNVIGNTYCAKLLRYFRPGVIIAAGVFMIGTSLMVIALSGSFIFLCIFAVPTGLSMGFIDAIVNNYAALYFKPMHMSWLHCSWGVGATTGPAVVSHGMTRYDSWRRGYYILGAIQFLLVLISVIALPLWKKVYGAAEQARKLPPTKYAVLFRLDGLIKSLTANFCYCSIEMTAVVWGSSYLVMVKAVPADLAARWMSLFFIGMTAGRLFSGFLLIKLSTLQLIRLSCVVIAIGTAVLFLSSNDLMYTGGIFLLGLGCGPVFPCIMYDIPKHFGAENSPSAVGLHLACANIGCAAAPPVFGLITTYIGYGAFPWYICAWLAGVIIAVEALNRRKCKA